MFPQPPEAGAEKSHFRIAAKRLEVDEKVSRVRFDKAFCLRSDALYNRTAFAINPNE